MLRHKLTVLLGSLAVLPLAACGGGAGGASGVASSTSAGAPARAGVAAQAPASSAAKPAADATIPSATVPEGPRVQRSARIALQVPNGRFDGALNEVIAVVEAAGGYISGQDAQAADQGQPLRSGQVTFQVPADKFESIVGAVRRKGTARSVSISGTDVSQQYVDLQARLRNAEAQRDAMLALMQQARTVNDTIQVENQLGQVTGQIEQLKGQIAFLDHSTTYATVAVTIQEDAVAAPRDDWGVQTAAAQALHNFVAVLAFLVLAIGTLAPLLVGAAAAFWVGRLAWRRLGRPRAANSPSASPAE
jgi:hypothetical protein